ncbi:MAG: glycosyltransferase [Geminicoccaceae bacterium]
MPARDDNTVRIAILLDDLSGGGVERSMLTLAGGFRRRGHTVDLILARRAGPLESEVPANMRVLVLPENADLGVRLAIARADPGGIGVLARPLLLARRKRLGRMPARLPSLVAYLRRERPDVLLAAKLRPNLAAVWARRLARVPTRVVLTERTSPSEHFPMGRNKGRNQDVRHLMHRTYPQADAIVTVSRDLADDLARFADLPRASIQPIYNPVVDSRLEEAARETPDHPWLAEGEPPVILAVGRIEPRKGFTTLLRAFAQVRERRPVRLVILGGMKNEAGGHEQALLDLARQFGIEADLSLPGFRLNPFAYMARAAVFVLPSEYEGLPGVLIQALACGCPVVSTDCPTGPREILEGGRYGPLVPVGDHRAMADAIAATLDDPLPPDLLRERGREFGVDASTDAYLALFDELRGEARSSSEARDVERPVDSPHAEFSA